MVEHYDGRSPEVARMWAKSSFVVFIDSGNAKGAALYQNWMYAAWKPIIPLRIEYVPVLLVTPSVSLKAYSTSMQ